MTTDIPSPAPRRPLASRIGRIAFLIVAGIVVVAVAAAIAAEFELDRHRLLTRKGSCSTFVADHHK